MKNLILILLLITLPFQMAMATTSVYCQNDDGDDAVTVIPSKQFPLSVSDSGKLHARCGCCHIDPIGMIAPELHLLPVSTTDAACVLLRSIPFSSISSSPPERPNWTRLPA